jgi:hypothetical protein
MVRLPVTLHPMRETAWFATIARPIVVADLAALSG